MLSSGAYRIVLKSNCDTPIDVWLVSGHHQHQQKEDDEVAFANSHAMSANQVKHEPDGIAGTVWHTTLHQLPDVGQHNQPALQCHSCMYSELGARVLIDMYAAALQQLCF